MEFARHAQYALIGFLITLTIVIRYPSIPHHYGIDAYFIHGMAHSISINHFASWIAHPSSFYGLYPLSYPTGIPYVLSALSLCTGVEIESIILIFSMLFGLLGAFGAFIMVGEINNSFLLKFSSAFAFSLAPVFLRFTYWTMSTRAPFIVFLPFLLFLLFRCINQRHKNRYVILALILLITMPAMHHFAFLLPIVIVAFLTTMLVSFAISYAKKKLITDKEISTVISPILFTLFIILFFLEAHEFTLYANKMELFKRYIISGNEPYVIFLNLCILYGLYYGAIIVFSAIGFSLLILKIDKTRIELFIILLLLFFISFLIDTTYLSFFVLPLIIPFIGLGIFEVLKNIEDRKFISISVFIAVILLSVIFTEIAQNEVLEQKFAKKSGFKQWIDDKSYNTALYIRTIESNGSLISNDYQLHRRLWAISGIPIMPFDGLELFFFNSSVDKNLKIKRIPISKVYLEHHDQLWEVDWENSKISINEPYWIINNDSLENKVKKNLSKYGVNYGVENNHLIGKYGSSRSYSEAKTSRFFKNLPLKKYKIYNNGWESIWYLQ